MKKIIALAVLAACATAASAGDYYIGADVGTGKWTSVSLSDTSYGLFGGYKLNESIDIELGYRNLLNKSATSGSASANLKVASWQASGVFKLPLSTDFNFYARLGLNSIRLNASASYPGYNQTGSANETKLLAGLGISYNISKEVGLRAEFQKQASDVQSLTVGATFAF